MGTLKYTLILSLVSIATSFKEIQDGSKILPASVKDTYSIPLLRGSLKRAVAEENEVSRGAYDDAEFKLLHRMKTVEIPPSFDSQDFYASTRQIHPTGRFNSRVKRSPQGLKFDGESSSKGGSSQGGSNNHPKSIADKLPRSPEIPQGSSVNFDGNTKDRDGNMGGGGGEDDDKRHFPGLYGGGYGHPYGHHHGGGGHYGGHPYYPTAGHQQGYPGGYYGNGGYPGGYYGNGGYPGISAGYPGGYPGGLGGGGGGGSSASAAASSGGGGGYRPGYGGGGLYGNGYPGNYGGGNYGGGYPNTYPIVNGGFGGFPPPGVGGFGGGFFRDEDGKGSKVSAGVSDVGGKVAGGVSFE